MLNIINLFLFIVSPFLALPTILYGFVKKSKFSFYLLVIVFGIIGYLYVPHINNDKARYYEMYESVSYLSFTEFFLYNSLNNIDFIFQLLIYFFSRNNFEIQYLFFLVASTSVFFLFNVILKLLKNKNVENNNSLYLLILCLVSVSIEDLYSGIRFVFAVSVVLNSYYLLIFDNKKILAFFLFFIALFIHFSILVFILPFFLKRYIESNDNKFLMRIFYISCFFIFIPQQILLDLISKVGFTGVLAEKSDAYLTNEDFVSTSIKEVGQAVQIRYFMYSIWIYLSYAYIYLTKNTSNLIRNLFLIVISTMNLFWAFPTIFFRYGIFVKTVLLFMIIYEYNTISKFKFKYLFLFSFFIIFLTQIMLMRYNFAESFITRDVFSLYDILASEPIREHDFLK